MRKKLVVISHTEHYIKDGVVVGWGPTISEINYLSSFWEEIVHIGCLYEDDAPQSSRAYSSNNIKFSAIKPFGGDRLYDKLKIIFKFNEIIKVIKSELRGATEVQLRLPTGIGVMLLPWFSLRNRNYTLWVKYAGNWAQANPPIGYAFQKWFLAKNFAKCKVTMNGYWQHQPPHCISFENPCLFDEEIDRANLVEIKKEFTPPFKILFVGQLRTNKGVDRILDALRYVKSNLVSQAIFAGDGPDVECFRLRASKLDIECIFLGFQSRENVHELLRSSHFILLPSDSEGFPKVIAEASCFGVVPIVSSVSSIPHYINKENGFLWDINSSFTNCFLDAIKSPKVELEKKSEAVRKIASLFTFESFYEKLEKKIL
jgi:glycosyltransferase involved in cell wall biosynthesis